MVQPETTPSHDGPAQLARYAAMASRSMHEVLSYQAGLASIATDLCLGAIRAQPGVVEPGQQRCTARRSLHAAETLWRQAVRDVRRLNDASLAWQLDWFKAALDSVTAPFVVTRSDEPARTLPDPIAATSAKDTRRAAPPALEPAH